MGTLSISEDDTRWGVAIDHAQHEPIFIEKDGKPVAVLQSVEDYARMKEAEKRELDSLCEELDAEIARGFASGTGDNLPVEEFLQKCIRDYEAGKRFGPPR